MYKLIVTDLDNTLLAKDGSVPKSTIEICKKLVKKGHVLAIATGRSYPSAKAIGEKIGIDTPLICYNGANIRNLDGTYIYKSVVPKDVQEGIVEFVRERQLYLQVYDKDEIVVEKLNTKAHPDPDLKFVKYKETKDLKKLKDIETPKLLIAAPPSEVPTLQQELEKLYGDKAYFAQSESHLIEVMEKGVNKGQALDILAEKLNVKKEEIMALGDNTNDALLLTHAGFRVAMANAVNSLKEIADYVATKKRSEGFNEAIKKFILK